MQNFKKSIKSNISIVNSLLKSSVGSYQLAYNILCFYNFLNLLLDILIISLAVGNTLSSILLFISASLKNNHLLPKGNCKKLAVLGLLKTKTFNNTGSVLTLN